MKNLFALIFILNASLSFAQSDILITPFRVVLENGKTIEELSVANTGTDTARYTISFVQYKMESNGKLVQIDSPEEGQYFADRYLRIFPKSVVLAPKEAQIVRLQARMPSDLAEGEYRSHLYFRSAGEQKAIGFEAEGADGLGIQLIPVYGVTIPVIVRLGESDSSVRLENLSLIEEDVPALTFSMNRSGIHSTYGDIEVKHIDENGFERILGLVRGVAVYTPLIQRFMSVPFNKDQVLPTSGTIRVEYASVANGKRTVFAEASISLN